MLSTLPRRWGNILPSTKQNEHGMLKTTSIARYGVHSMSGDLEALDYDKLMNTINNHMQWRITQEHVAEAKIGLIIVGMREEE